jgi:pimeloyl-ACP methyl ester carboxylesterase
MSDAIWWGKFVRAPVFTVAAAYLLLVVSAPTLAASMLYYPQMASRVAPEGTRRIPMPGGGQLAVLHLPNPQARYTLWFFHGNAEALGDLEPLLQAMRDAGFSVFAFDYPGYGVSDGKPSEATLYAASRAAREYLRGELKVSAAQTLMYGRSLGSGPAVQMATEERVGGLVIQSGFMSAFRVVTRIPVLPFDQFKNLGKLPRVKSPVLVIHGERDEVISFAHGKALFAAAAEPKRKLWVAGAGHNNLIEIAGQRFWTALRDFSDVCAANPG